MSENLHPNTIRVIEAARAAGFEIQTKRFPEGTKTAQDAPPPSEWRSARS